MLNDFMSMSLFEQAITLGFVTVSIAAIVFFLFMEINVPVESDTQRDIRELEERHEAKLKKVKDEYEAYKVNDIFEDEKEAARLELRT